MIWKRETSFQVQLKNQKQLSSNTIWLVSLGKKEALSHSTDRYAKWHNHNEAQFGKT